MKYSYHNHSTHSDGTQSIDELVEHAKMLGLDEMGISDHYALPIPGQTKAPFFSIQDLDAYIADVLRFSEHKNPIIKLGIETDFYPKKIDKIKKKLSGKPFDYIIGSIHVVDTLPINVKPENLQNLSNDDMTKIVKRFWEITREMAESRIFDIVGHLDLTKKFNLQATNDISDEINAALDAIKQANMTIELNTSGWQLPCKKQYPSRKLLEQCKQRDIPVMISADAHKAVHLTRDFDKAYELLIDIGYTQVAYYTKRKRLFTPIST